LVTYDSVSTSDTSAGPDRLDHSAHPDQTAHIDPKTHLNHTAHLDHTAHLNHTGERRRAELGKFLKARRARLSPDDFGLAPGTRRRTPGLRREEVALLAGVGVTWYTWLEQGRPINASPQVLDAVARTLRLDGAEREHLYRLAEAMPLVVMEAVSPAVPESIVEIVRSLAPLPAVLMNGRFDVLESNPGHRALFRDWHTMPCIHRNLLWCTITEPAARSIFINYDTEVRYMVARLRAGYGQHVGDPAWEEDISRLIRLSGEFAELWSRHEVAEPQPRNRIFIHPEAGRMEFTATEFEVPYIPCRKMLVYTPCDDRTRDELYRICGGVGAEPDATE
jgi:transcriptional regulator with XRE-family HTH domain